MVRQLNKKLTGVIDTIINSRDYKACLEIKKKMGENEEVVNLVEKIKKLQKKYVNTNDLKLLQELEELENRLNDIPIYVVYMQHLEKVNQMINFVKDELNNYFYEVLNK